MGQDGRPTGTADDINITLGGGGSSAERPAVSLKVSDDSEPDHEVGC